MQMWDVRTLNRNISTQYYERHYVQPSLPSESAPVPQKEEILKTPMMAEFLGFKPDDSFSERDLESSIITHLRDFMMELGHGFAFVARQQHIRTDAEDYFIDLVFYNVVLKCYVLVDLKVGKITHQDVGQMDMYVRMYDELKRTEGDNPTIGIVLCSETDKDIARYSILKGNLTPDNLGSHYPLPLAVLREAFSFPVWTQEETLVGNSLKIGNELLAIGRSCHGQCFYGSGCSQRYLACFRSGWTKRRKA